MTAKSEPVKSSMFVSGNEAEVAYTLNIALILTMYIQFSIPGTSARRRACLGPLSKSDSPYTKVWSTLRL